MQKIELALANGSIRGGVTSFLTTPTSLRTGMRRSLVTNSIRVGEPVATP